MSECHPFGLDTGRAARQIREADGLSQIAAAAALGVTNVHLSNVERGLAIPGPGLLRRYRERFGIDPHVLAWCLSQDVPFAVLGAAVGIAGSLRQLITEAQEVRIEATAIEAHAKAGGTTQ